MRVRPRIALVPSLLLLVACANAPTRSGDGGRIDHATGADDLLVRVAFEGGFVPLEWNLTNLPTFSLYGDGTLVAPGAQIELYPGPALPAIFHRTVDEEGIQAILRETLEAVDGAPADLGDMGSMSVADAATTVITVSADGVERTIEAYALSEIPDRPQGMPEDVYRARQRLADLVTRLGSLDQWLPDGSLGPETTYDGASARLFVGDHRKVDDLPQEPVSWPLGVDLAAFGSPTDQPDAYRCGTLGGEEWATVREAATRANELTPWTDGSARFTILFRPLLPDESGC
jgi:hypothetical protein